jgi:hypothetical protein
MLKVSECGFETINESEAERNPANFRTFNDHYKLNKDPSGLIGTVSEKISNSLGVFSTGVPLRCQV